LLSCLELKDKVLRLIEKLCVYAQMRRDEDNSNSKYQAMADRAEGLSNEVEKELSFITPEIISIPTEIIDNYIKEDDRLKIYRHYLDSIIRMKEHVLSPDEERIISMAGDIAQVPENAFRMLSHADMKFPTVKNEEGENVELSEGRYYQLSRSSNREVRKNAFEQFYSTYKKYENTFAATYNGTIKKDIFYARVRNYNSAIEAALFPDNIPKTVFDNVVNTINNNLEPLHKYIDIKRKALGIEKVHMYDIYAPIVKDIKIKVPFEEGVDIVLKGLKPLGDKYISLLKKGFESRWIDVYENQGKTSGAYSWGSYDTNPYVLLNYNGMLPDVMTVAHEMGHSIHSYLSRKEQPYISSEYTLFCAEVASTTNEAILIDYLLKTTKDKNMRIYLLNQHLEEIRTTIYRQTMFAEFEKKTHELVEKGEALTSQVLSGIWHDINVKYYGPDILVDDAIDIEWARVPHFYWNFYVYKYVTGYAAALTLSKKIIEEGESAVKDYIRFLKSGGSDYSTNLLRDAGVDMTKPEPLENAVKVFEELLDSLEKEL
ncbi:MAG: oligoendopeptidase F, partial [Candidatus Afipia apatlaquensis]|nr:oligoendopeptidase F [Candidatus Afipia apatlaquensis]